MFGMNPTCTHKHLVEEEPLQRVEGCCAHHGERAGPPDRASCKGHSCVRETGKLHADIYCVCHDMDALAMPQAASYLGSRRPGRECDGIALINHLCRRNGNAPF